MDGVFSKKNLITYLILAIIALAIPLTVTLVQTRLNFIPKAAGTEITCTDLPQQGGNCISPSKDINFSLDSPYGPPDQSVVSTGSTATTSQTFPGCVPLVPLRSDLAHGAGYKPWDISGQYTAGNTPTANASINWYLPNQNKAGTELVGWTEAEPWDHRWSCHQ